MNMNMNIPQNYFPQMYSTSLSSQYGLPFQTIKSELEDVSGTQGKTEPNKDDLDFSVHVRPEIRKGCVWEVQFKLSDEFLSKNPINKMYAKVASLDKEENRMNQGEYYCLLKIRSKLIEPRKEVPFDKVAECVSNSLRVDIVNGSGVLRVKFTKRPRNIFHKHADVMILVAGIYCGEELLEEDQQELIFRGGTGSAHSAENRKLSVLKKNSNNIAHSGYSVNPSLYSAPHMLGVYPYSIPQTMPVHQHQPPVQQQQVPQQQAPQNNIITAEGLTVPELDEFDTDTFFSDFMNNKGDSLAGFESPLVAPPTNTPDYSNNYLSGNRQQTYGESAPAFSFNVTGFQVQPNGIFQGTIEGVYLNKPFRGSFQSSISDTSLQGSFTGTFN